MSETREFEAGAECAGTRLDLYLLGRFPDVSRARLQDWIKAGRVRVNGANTTKPALLLRGGEHIAVQPAERPPLRAVAEEIPLQILYEDDDVVAIDKPAGMVVHAGAGNHEGTLVNALLHRFGALSQLGGDLRPGIVHRLDRDTSGVLLVAKNDAAHRHLAQQFSAREVEKIYITLVHGRMPAQSGRIEKPITRDPVHRTRMTARLGEGRSARTDWKVIRQYEKLALLEVRIGTGRTHQIRVHLSSVGHAVVGDRLYGAPAQAGGRPTLGRQFLHAHRITFTSRLTGDRIRVESPLPADLDRFLVEIL